MNDTLNFISSIWEDDCIEKLDNNQWECLWCDITIHIINSTKDLSRVLGISGMHIKSFSPAIEKYHWYIYKDIWKQKAYKKIVINDHMHKVNSSISRLQDKSLEVIDNTMYSNSGSRYLSNITAKSDSSVSAQHLPYHQKINQQVINKVLCYYLVITVTRKSCFLTRFSVQVQFEDFIISEGLSPIISQNLTFVKVLYLVINESEE